MACMRTQFFYPLAITVLLNGCASYRTDSNITTETSTEARPAVSIQILEGTPQRKYKELGPIEVSVKKLTVFHKDPTRDQANEALVEKAKIIGADAVIKVTYESGIGMMTWGYIDAKGTGVKFTE